MKHILIAIVVCVFILLLSCNNANNINNISDGDVKVSIAYPAEGQVINEPIWIKIDITNIVEVSAVHFLVDGVEVDYDTLAPFKGYWVPYAKNGTDFYQIEVLVDLKNGNRILSESIKAQSSSYVKPAVTVISPLEAQTIYRLDELF